MQHTMETTQLAPSYLCLWYPAVLQHLDGNQRICAAMMRDDVDVRVQPKHFFESC